MCWNIKHTSNKWSITCVQYHINIQHTYKDEININGAPLTYKVVHKDNKWSHKHKDNKWSPKAERKA